jgi:hypothetical protein
VGVLSNFGGVWVVAEPGWSLTRDFGYELKATHLLVVIRSFSVCGIVAKFYRDSAENHPPADARFFLGDGGLNFSSSSTLQSLFDFSIYDLAVQRLVTTIRVATDR